MTRTAPPRIAAAQGIIAGAVIFCLVAIAFGASIGGEFLWDDDAHITRNPCIVGPLGFREIWTTSAANYFPLVLTNFRLQHALWGLDPRGYHVVTILFHAAAAILLWRVLRRLGCPGAWVGAAVWAVHPVQVESVAWICELKNTQSAVFFLLSILWYLRWISRSESGVPIDAGSNPNRSAATYAASLAFAVLAILSKPSTVMLPVVLLLLTAWHERRITVRRGAMLLPFFAISAVAALWTVWEQKFHSGAIGAEWNQSVIERLAVAGRAPWFYLGKLVWPAPLSFIYERWSFAAATPVLLFPLLALAAVLWFVWAFRGLLRNGPAIALACFVALLFPVLGFFDVYFFRYSFVGDHFQYLASMAPLALAGIGLSQFGVRGRLAAYFLLAGLTALSARHSLDFRDNASLWQSSLEGTPNAAMPWSQIGASRSLQGDHREAVQAFSRALSINPDDFDAHNGMAAESLLAGNVTEARIHVSRALELQPQNADAHNNLGMVLSRSGDLQGAVREFREALRLRPDQFNPKVNLANALGSLGRATEALPLLEQALQSKPDDAEIEHNLGNAYRLSGNSSSATKHFLAALRLQPRPETHDDLGLVLLSDDRTSEAIEHFRMALQLDPRLTSAREHLALAYDRLAAEAGKTSHFEEALKRSTEAIAANPKLASAHFNQGAAFAALGKWNEARGSFTRAVELSPGWADAHRNLGIALATTGNLEAARQELVAAVTLDPNSPDTHRALGRVLEGLGRSAEAQEHLQRAAALDGSRN